MPLRFLLDENQRGLLWRAIVRHNQSGLYPLDVERVGGPPDLPLGSSDAEILLWAEREDLIFCFFGRRLVEWPFGTVLPVIRCRIQIHATLGRETRNVKQARGENRRYGHRISEAAMLPSNEGLRPRCASRSGQPGRRAPPRAIRHNTEFGQRPLHRPLGGSAPRPCDPALSSRWDSRRLWRLVPGARAPGY